MSMRILGCISAMLLISSVQGQQALVDSISRELKMPMADSNRAMSMMRLAIDYEVVDTAKAYQAYRNAIQFAREKKLYYQLGRIYQNQSFLFTSAANYPRTKADLDTAISYYLKSDHPNAKLWEANAYGDMANIFRHQNDVPTAIQYHLKCISILEQLKLDDKLVVRYINVSTIFGDILEFAKQKEYANKALNAAKKSGYRPGLFMAYFMLAHTANAQDETLVAKKYIDSARIYFVENSNIDIQFSFYLVAGQVFKKMNELDSAFYFFNKSYEVSSIYNYSYGKA